MNDSSPAEILDVSYESARRQITRPFLKQPDHQTIVYLCRQLHNRAPIRFLMAACLAKIDTPSIDIRAPYTEIQDHDFAGKTYSGRTYDEQYVEPFVLSHELPVRVTTAFLTPAFRTKNVPLYSDVDLGGRSGDKPLYSATLRVLNDIEQGRLAADGVLKEIIRELLLQQQEQEDRLSALLKDLPQKDTSILSAEDIVTLIQQHLSSPRASRLPVLVVAAAYVAASKNLGERVLPLHAHNAADSQTGSHGDLEVTLVDDESVITSYEMKMKVITREDVDRAVGKVAHSGSRVENYIFITTEPIDEEVAGYASSMYREVGTEFVILDCLGFLRYFLHLFYRIRLAFLDAYQELLLSEPDSAVRQSLKESFLALRRAAESGYD